MATLLLFRPGKVANFPERRLAFLNRGISGNTSVDLASRWKPDALDLAPDVLSILIGVNDVNHALRAGLDFSVDEYAQRYDAILSETIAALPRVKLILGEPFFGPGTATAEKIDQWKQIMPQVARSAQDVGRGPTGSRWCHIRRCSTAAAERAPAEYWIWDGIHPTFAGHQLMADHWKRTYRAFYGDAKME